MLQRKSISLYIVLSFSLLTASIQSTMSPTALADCYQGPDASYKYLEFLFIDTPKNECKKFAKDSRNFLMALTTAYVVGRNFTSTPISIDSTTIASTLFLSVLYDMYVQSNETNVKKETLLNFLRNWSFHKNYVPAELRSAFDELAKAMEVSPNKTISNEQVNEIFAVIQHLIEHEFAKRYEKDKMKDTDTLSMIKTITDISKNLK